MWHIFCTIFFSGFVLFFPMSTVQLQLIRQCSPTISKYDKDMKRQLYTHTHILAFLSECFWNLFIKSWKRSRQSRQMCVWHLWKSPQAKCEMPTAYVHNFRCDNKWYDVEVWLRSSKLCAWNQSNAHEVFNKISKQIGRGRELKRNMSFKLLLLSLLYIFETSKMTKILLLCHFSTTKGVEFNYRLFSFSFFIVIFTRSKRISFIWYIALSIPSATLMCLIIK